MSHPGQPIIIAHRGASGSLPEHTLAAYQLAIEQEADFIEPDLVATQDSVLIARHEPNLIDTTNVADLPQFADRRRTVVIDGLAQTGFFCHDFTLAEIKTLRARQAMPDRDQSYNDRFEIPTLAEILDLVQQAETATGRKVGIYPETKHPTYFDQLGLSLEEPLLELLLQTGFTDPQRVFIQSFEVHNLQVELPQLMAAAGLQLPLVQLIDELHLRPYDFVMHGDSRTYGNLLTPDSLKEMATYAAAIGIWKGSLLDPQVICQAHAAGLQVHVYTFRNESRFLTAGAADPMAEYRQFFDWGVDGVFSDFPETALQARRLVSASLNQQ
jgi:glycerophosphoryl diester phosphodiesterase